MTKGKRIRELREKQGISQTELAEKINVSKQNLYKYENDIITNIPSDKIELIAKILHTTPSYIMGWNENQSTHEDEPIIIRRLRKGTSKMDEKQQEKMMNILKASFEDLFDDDV